ncbi:MAG: hypothetical protein HFF52_06970 [Lawsonibacter sp.]|nr:hypothetical protein [Lawsonibacter sp.]
MSMPSFPKNGADMTREEALTMIIACIAMEELALSHILNAGGEHLQFILGTLPGTSSQDVLAAHKSITALIEAVTHNQMLLKNKLDHVLEFVPRPSEPSQPAFPVQPPSQPSFPSQPPSQPSFPSQPPSPSAPYPPAPYVPVCPPPPQYPAPWPPSRPAPYRVLPCKKSVLQLTGQREKMLWEPDSRLPWRQRSRSGRDICWDGHAPEQIQLNPWKTYVVQYTLNVCATSRVEGTGKILLCQSPCGAFADTPPLCLSLECLTRGPQTLQHVSVLHPRSSSGCAAELSLMLNAKTPLCVERAVMDIVEL